jgi:hypothetical protein
MERRQDPERMKKLLARRERQGWSFPELSRRSGLPVWKLHWWKKRLSEKRKVRRSRVAFAAVQVVRSPQASGRPLEVITASGVRILVPGDFEAEHLKRVIEAVESGC